jgi:HlyD family secretion protein
VLATLAVMAMAGCKKAVPAPVYETLPVEQRDIVVSAHATGTVQADTTVEVKTRASGEVLGIKVETGQVVKQGALLMQVDPRLSRNSVAQADANVAAAKVQLNNATVQKGRSDSLLAAQAITVQEHDQDVLSYANAKAALVSAQVVLDNERISLEDANVRAPITGTVIEIDVARGQVIASATSNVGGGTTLLKMADLNLVQVSTPVDETDIGKIQPGQAATVLVQAFPTRPFTGTVLKIEPKDTVQQNVTMFPVRVRIDNRNGLLRPGMNADVEIHVGQRTGVPAVANAALRTMRDVASAAQVLGLDPQAVQATLQQQQQQQRPPDGRADTAGAPGSRQADTSAAGPPNQGADQRGQAGGGGGTGGTGGGATGGARGRRGGGGATTGGRYIVFVQRNNQPVPVWVRTGLTDLDYSEVVEGLQTGDSVYILPSASLVQSQQQFKQRITNLTGGGGLPGMRQQSGSTGSTPPAGGAAAPR